MRAERKRLDVSFHCSHCGVQCVQKKDSRGNKFCSPACNYAGKMKHPDEHFWPKVDKSGECWIWTGGQDGHGYGKVYYQCRREKTHRLSWMLIRGPIPEGLCVLHNCPTGDNPACCNPAHLWLGTNADNMRDMAVKGRSGQTRLSADDVLRAMVLRFAGWTLKRIAGHFSVSESAIQSIAAGRQRTYVTGFEATP